MWSRSRSSTFSAGPRCRFWGPAARPGCSQVGAATGAQLRRPAVPGSAAGRRLCQRLDAAASTPAAKGAPLAVPAPPPPCTAVLGVSLTRTHCSTAEMDRGASCTRACSALHGLLRRMLYWQDIAYHASYQCGQCNNSLLTKVFILTTFVNNVLSIGFEHGPCSELVVINTLHVINAYN